MVDKSWNGLEILPPVFERSIAEESSSQIENVEYFESVSNAHGQNEASTVSRSGPRTNN
jgi:hypothetical protein